MKGQSKEIIEITLLVVSLSIVLIISFFLFTSKTPHLKFLIAEKHQYDRITDTIRVYFYSKPRGIDRNFAQLLGDSIYEGGDVVSYGKDISINVTDLTYQYFDEYSGKGHWHLTISQTGRAIVAIVSDTSSSMKPSVQQISEKIPELADLISNIGEIKIIFYRLGDCKSVSCDLFEETEYFECEDIPSTCKLKESECEDWGHGAACVIKQIKPQLLVVLSDELSMSSNSGKDNCCETGNIPSWSRDSVEEAKTEMINNDVKGFAFQPIFDCGKCSKRCNECIQKTTEQMNDLTSATGGKTYMLTQASDAGDELIKVLKSGIKVEKIEMGYPIPRQKNIRTFKAEIPLPGKGGRHANAVLYEW